MSNKKITVMCTFIFYLNYYHRTPLWVTFVLFFFKSYYFTNVVFHVIFLYLNVTPRCVMCVNEHNILIGKRPPSLREPP